MGRKKNGDDELFGILYRHPEFRKLTLAERFDIWERIHGFRLPIPKKKPIEDSAGSWASAEQERRAAADASPDASMER